MSLMRYVISVIQNILSNGKMIQMYVHAGDEIWKRNCEFKIWDGTDWRACHNLPAKQPISIL